MSRDLRLLAGAAGLSALGDFLAVLPLILTCSSARARRSRSPRCSSPCGDRWWWARAWPARSSTASRTARCWSACRSRRRRSWSGSPSASTRCRRCCRSSRCSGSASRSSQPAEFALVPAAAGRRTLRARQRQDGDGAVARLHRRPAGRRRARRRRAAVGWRSSSTRRRSWSSPSAALALRARRRPARTRRRTRARARRASRCWSREPELAITLGGAVAALALFTMCRPRSRSSSPTCWGPGARLRRPDHGVDAGDGRGRGRARPPRPAAGPRRLRARRRRRCRASDRRRRRVAYAVAWR